MTNEEKTIFDNIMAEIKANQLTVEKVQELIKNSGLVDTKAIDDLKAEIKAITDAQGLKITEIEQKGEDKKPATIKAAIEQNLDKIKGFTETESGRLKISLNAEDVVKTITAASITSDSAQGTIDGVGQIHRGMEFMRNIFPTKPAGNDTHGSYQWWEQLAITDNSSAVDEGVDAASESTSTWVRKTIDAKRLNAWTKASADQLQDVSWMAGEINDILRKSMRLKENAGLLTGTGLTNNIAGVKSYATAFSSASSPKYVNASILNLLSACKTQINRDTLGGATANYALMHPNVADALRNEKDELGRPINLAWATGETLNIMGLTIIESALVDESDLYVFDSRMASLIMWNDLTIEIWRQDSDFTNGLFTVNAYLRENLLVKDVDKKAFVFVDDITAAKSEINLGA